VPRSLLDVASESTVIALISSQALRDSLCSGEVVRCLANRQPLIPIILGRPKGLTDDLRFYCAGNEYYCISDPPTDRELVGVVASIARNLVRAQQRYWR